MPYSPTTWVEGVTTLGPTNLNHIEQGIANVGTGSGLPAQLQPVIGAPPSNNLNSIVATGWYTCASSTNAPTTGGYVMGITDDPTNWQAQTYWDTNVSPPSVWTRAKESGTWGAWAILSHTTVDAVLSANVSMTSGATYYDGPSASFTAGTWMVWYKMLFELGTTSRTQFSTRLWDGTTTYDEAESDSTGTSSSTYLIEVSGFAVVTLGSTTTLKISGRSDQASSTMCQDVLAGGGSSANSHTTTRLTAVRVA